MTTYTVNANGAAGNGTTTFSNLEDAVEAADAHAGFDTILLSAGQIQLEGATKDGQVSIDDVGGLSIVGAGKTSTVISTDTSIVGAQNTSTAAIITVQAGVTANFSNLTLNGGDVDAMGTTDGGVDAATGILFYGSGLVNNAAIVNVGADVELEPRGAGINIFGPGDDVNIINTDFAQNERRDIGVFDGRTANVQGSTFHAKLIDDDSSPNASVEYGLDIQEANAVVTGSTFTGYDATQDLFSSAAILAGSFGGAASTVTVSNSSFTDNSNAVVLGFFPDDTSSLTLSGAVTVNSSVTDALAVAAQGDVTITGAQALAGQDAAIQFFGGDDPNTVAGGIGNDQFNGDGSGDTFRGNGGNDAIDGGTGTDIAQFTGNLSEYSITFGENGAVKVIDLMANRDGVDTLHNVETLQFADQSASSQVFGAGADNFAGTNNADVVSLGGGDDFAVLGGGNDVADGGSGDDTIGGAEGNDSIQGGTGDDQLFGGIGDDFVVGGTGDDTVVGGIGNDQLGGGSGDDLIQGEDGNDLLYGGSGDDSLGGGVGNDFLAGQSGNDQLFGGDGNDVLDGGAGVDFLMGNAGNDFFVFKAGEANGDTVADFENGAAGHDEIDLVGYGQGATFTIQGNTLHVTSGDGLTVETIHVFGALQATDVHFFV